jgi:hypothetical protein
VGRSARRPLLALVLVAALGLALVLGLPGLGASSRAAGAGPGEATPRTDGSVPASKVTMLGATPSEPGAAGPNETWGLGVENANAVLVRYTAGTGWVQGPALEQADGAPLAKFTLDENPLAGQMTSAGSGVLVGTVEPTPGHPSPGALVRDAGQPFVETAPVPAADLEADERLFSTEGRAPMIAPLDEAGGAAGALVVPIRAAGAVEEWVLHWDGQTREWTREPIEIPASSTSEFRVLAIGASSPENAWLLARLATPTGGVELFRREPATGGAVPAWKPVAPVGGSTGEALTVELAHSNQPFVVPGAEGPGGESVESQLLTVTEDGVWIDGVRADVHVPTTMYYKIGSAPSITSWCETAGSPAAEECTHKLPEPPPTGFSRSIAWASTAAHGERIITGLEDGVSLRLEGDVFKRVLSLGGGASEADDPGALYGAAFTNPREGWLGAQELPIHLSLEPVGARLQPWPVSFRHPLLAVVPQPEAPVGSLSSEALAVGDRGEVARYLPGKGWEPESLFGPGEQIERPQLRAVAWPTPTRAYAVGEDNIRETDASLMWLWRGETGLWEPDPASPANFRGNLVGIAFDPSDPAIGYAVGSGAVRGEGVLLRYGKTWTQEPAQALPAQARGAEFTAVAFAGSEALVAYRKRGAEGSGSVGGLLVNSGSGWRIDQAAAEAMGSRTPAVVAGLPDGGAAFAAEGGEGGPELFEREAAGRPWRGTSLPGAVLPGSLALFRENGALRAITSGSSVFGSASEITPEPPPGSPPELIEPFPIGETIGVLRQTASGWSDEQHERSSIGPPPGKYFRWDEPYEPDPVYAALVGPSGSEGWAVGGFVNEGNELLETADVERYPTEQATPDGVGTSSIAATSSEATFAIGGGAACAAPCATRAEAKLGPDVWLEHAIQTAASINKQPGSENVVRDFFYTGPRLANRNETSEKPIFPYSEELERYRQVLGGDSSLPAYPVIAPTELDEANREGPFEAAFEGELPAGRTCAGGTPGCHSAYALRTPGPAGQVRVIVLDESSFVGDEQLKWLEAELEEAKSEKEPAIAIGNKNVKAQSETPGPEEGPARELATVLVFGKRAHQARATDGASAYFYDQPEENVKGKLSVGGESIDIFGSGTLGYINVASEQQNTAFLGSSGFLLAKVNAQPAPGSVAAQIFKEANRAPVTVSLIPNIGELALEAQEGTLLRRSEVAQFAGLARRSRSGTRVEHEQPQRELQTDPYIPIPSVCVGAACAERIETEFTFTSTEEGVKGEFVEPNTATHEHNAVLLNAQGEPVEAKTHHSGLYCAFNPGEPTITVSAGGLSASLKIKIQAGSVRRPCGTVPAHVTPPVTAQASAPVPPPAPAPAPAPSAAPTPLVALPAPPGVLPPPPTRPAAPRPTPPVPFVVLPAPASPLLAAVPPPVPTPARPTPPSGTSPVTTPVEAPEKQEEQEEAPESVSNKAVAYRASEENPAPEYLLGIVLLAAFAGAATRRRPRRGRRELRVAPATVSSLHSQRRASPPRRRTP